MSRKQYTLVGTRLEPVAHEPAAETTPAEGVIEVVTPEAVTETQEAENASDNA